MQKNDPAYYFDFKIKLSNGVWNVFGDSLHGITVTDKKKGKKKVDEGLLWISSDICNRKHLEIAIHESMHASNFSLSEDTVTRMAIDVAKVLWKIGYRMDGKTDK